MTLPQSLLEILRCPVCSPPTPLTQVQEAEHNWLLCATGQHRFPLVEGFADLRPENLKAPAPAALQNKE